MEQSVLLDSAAGLPGRCPRLLHRGLHCSGGTCSQRLRQHRRSSVCMQQRIGSSSSIRQRQQQLGCKYVCAAGAEVGLSSSDDNVPALESGMAFEVMGTVSEQRLAELREQFNKFDMDGNGVIDKSELRNLLEAVNSSQENRITQSWVVDAIVDSVMASFDHAGSNTLDFEEFANLMQDSVLLDGKLQEYQAAFQGADVSGNGKLGASEVRKLFESLGHSLSDQKLFNMMERFDQSDQGQLGFNEFLDLFRSDLLEANEVVEYIRLKANARMQPPRDAGSLIEWTPGEVMLIFSAEELDALAASHPRRVLVLEASFTWCRPCKGFTRSYQKFADAYRDTIFLKFFGNSNENTKALFQDRLRTPMTPTFTFWRNGELLTQHSGASKGKMLAALDQSLQEWDNPVAGANKFKQQVWSAKLLGAGQGA